MKEKNKLDQYEKEIEAQIDNYVSITGEKRQQIEDIIQRCRKTRNINIRISEYDLANLKRRAAAEGIPYQTLISSILHKYVTDRLVDEKDIIKSLNLLSLR